MQWKTTKGRPALSRLSRPGEGLGAIQVQGMWRATKDLVMLDLIGEIEDPCSEQRREPQRAPAKRSSFLEVFGRNDRYGCPRTERSLLRDRRIRGPIAAPLTRPVFLDCPEGSQ